MPAKQSLVDSECPPGMGSTLPRLFVCCITLVAITASGVVVRPVYADVPAAPGSAGARDVVSSPSIGLLPTDSSASSSGLRIAPRSEVISPSAPTLPPIAEPSVVSVSTGEASWYGPGFYGNRTASGEVYRPGTMTAAHRTLPFGTRVRVTNLWNGRTAVIRINDRGPFVAHRVIDLGHGAATTLGLVASGIAQVRLEVLR